jgi:hypothetical protein
VTTDDSPTPAERALEDDLPPGTVLDKDVLPVGLALAEPLDPAALRRVGGRPVGAVAEPGSDPRFDGDTSELPPEACWALQELIAAPHVLEQARGSWAALLKYEDQLRSRLSELGLLLELNLDRGYAFTRQASDPSPSSRTLLRARTLSLAASALALWLYNQYLIAPDEPVVEEADMIDHLLGYKPPADTDEAGFAKRARAAIRSLEEAHLIRAVTGTSRYLIYPVITAVLSAERVAVLTGRYRELAVGGPAGEDRPADDSAADDTQSEDSQQEAGDSDD